MPRQVFSYDPPERFVVGTVGEPGERTFFMQARGGSEITSVALEKFQVATLAQRIEELLDEVLRRSGGSSSIPAVAPQELQDNEPLEQPIMEEFQVGTMALAWDPDDERVVVEAQAASEDDEAEEVEPLSDEEVEGPDVLRVRVTAGAARAFADRAQQVVSAGRPPCPFCGLPLDSSGHVCPRQNGQRHPSTVT